ncbi:unnamed protein product [Mytilus coruscus]|uniref:Uncharacterized protein n=1 Tax=Mytilus coruscus TaxID=42192 RepID=A0A6J8C6S2_MYTCO|nr:unnamed protein product [Mytilus coruscus]
MDKSQKSVLKFCRKRSTASATASAEDDDTQTRGQVSSEIELSGSMASTSDAASTLPSNKPPYPDTASCDMKDELIKTQFVTECDHSWAYKHPFPSRALLLCGKHNIAIRGHTEERSNFMAILREFAEDDLVLKEHIQSTTARYKYTSTDVQNELLIICGKQISDKIVEDCNEAGFFSVLGDE